MADSGVGGGLRQFGGVDRFAHSGLFYRVEGLPNGNVFLQATQRFVDFDEATRRGIGGFLEPILIPPFVPVRRPDAPQQAPTGARSGEFVLRRGELTEARMTVRGQRLQPKRIWQLLRGGKVIKAYEDTEPSDGSRVKVLAAMAVEGAVDGRVTGWLLEGSPQDPAFVPVLDGTPRSATS